MTEPKILTWYLADLVFEIRVAQDTRNVIHINTYLLQAESAEAAYQRALERGAEKEFVYENTDGLYVSVSFRGIHELLEIYEKLEHGSEIAYSEKINLSETAIAALVHDQSELAVFRPRKPPSRDELNYMPRSVMNMLIEAGFDEDDFWSSEQ